VTQTTLNLFTKRILSAFVAVTIVTSCASQNPAQSKKPETNKPELNTEITPAVLSAQDYLSEAENKAPQESIGLLFSAANAYFQEGNYVESLWLANKLNELSLDEQQEYQLFLLKIDNLLASQKTNDVKKQLQLVDDFAKERNIIHSHRYYELVSSFEHTRGNFIRSVDAALIAYNLNHDASEDDIMLVWDKLSRLSGWELIELTKHESPLLEGWLNFVYKAKQSGDNKLLLDQQIAQFQFEYPNHPAQFVAEQLLLVTAAEEAFIQNVAVILPLSGKHKKIGEIVQQGLLASYKNEMTLHFVDSNQLDFAQLPYTFEEKAIDHVIGPLLKENVDEYVSILELSIPTLLLNTPTIPRLRDQHFAFSMKREDETSQAATILSNKSFNHPVIFSTQDRVSQRIASKFAQKWESLNGVLPEKILLESNRNMDKSLKASLDIDASQRRIRTLESHIRQAIEKDTRNRRDIDMVFLAAPAKYTRMIKPFLDVHTSTYASSIPIFSSSLSYTGNNKMSEIRDLSGLTFSEIPWFLESQEQDTAAANEAKTLWPSRHESLHRIYAMGLDALPLLKKINVLQQYPYLSYQGQTGEIKLNKNHVFSRSLLWGQFSNGEVKRIEME
jgi:outer membrane PBP1 activator LpoA protein